MVYNESAECPLFPDNPGHCRLILYLSIAAFFDSIAYLMGDIRPDGPTCDFQAWWLSFFGVYDWCVLMWVCIITFNLFMNVVKTKNIERFEMVGGSSHHIFPAVCWEPLWTSWGVVLSTWHGTYDPDSERQAAMLKEDIKSLRAYPFIYLAASIFPLINRIQNAAAPDDPVFALVILAALTAPLHGAMNAIVFGMDRETLRKLTPTQIKMAFLSHSVNPGKVREYPVASYFTCPEECPSSPLMEDSTSSRFPSMPQSRSH
uniref:G protein-coupled receptor GPR1/2/3 C-terminal domain-containing protein n=1 Tax=Magallana gigas TaxID=29159 RepID=K1PUK6_MAGGI